MKKLLLILLCLPMIGFGQNKILAKYNGTNALMGQFYEMNLLLCGNCHSDNLKDYKWKNISNWTKQGSKILRLSYYADINYDEDEIEGLESPYPDLFPTYKAYVDHHELYHRGPGPGGYGGYKDHEAMDILFRDLEEAIKEKNKNVDR